MPSPAVLDFDKLLLPIAGENPAGVDLRADSSPGSLYYLVKDARNAARTAERQSVMDGDDATSQADWRPVLKHATEALAAHSKDLELTAYLIEALVRLQGFAGLRDGLRLARELAEQFWDGLYPLPDEDGLETRVAPLGGLNGQEGEGTLINPITQVHLTEGKNAGPYAYSHYQQAAALSQVGDEATREKRVQAGAVSMQLFERAIAETPPAFFVNLVDDLTACQDEFGKLCAVLDEKCGAHSPPASNIRSALTSCLDTVTSLARDKLAVAPPPETTTEETESTAVQADGRPAVAEGAIRSREDAFRKLLELAEFFRRTEPHSPVSYALEQAVRWGRMTLPELLTELIGDEGPRNQFFKQIGIRPSEPS